ncbi:MAG: hypothetical protein ACR2OG_12955 [Gemmatimonadaceae bacterium]
MSWDELPVSEPRGALVPPDRHPPTAIGTGTPEPPQPPQPPRHIRHVTVERHVSFGPDLKRLVNKVLDAADRVAETIAAELGVRPASDRQSSPGPGGG